MFIIDLDELQLMIDALEGLNPSGSYHKRLCLNTKDYLKDVLRNHKAVGWFSGANPKIIISEDIANNLNELIGV